MSRHEHTGPIPGLELGWPLPLAVAVLAVGFALAWRFLPVSVGVLITIFVLFIGLLVTISLVGRLAHEAGWSHSEFAEVHRAVPDGGSHRAGDLVAFEASVAGAMRYQHDLYLQIRPTVRYLASSRLAAVGIDLDRDPRAAEALGPLYDFVKASADRPGHLFGAGVPLETLQQMADTLERIHE
jgi:hypothetical protein